MSLRLTAAVVWVSALPAAVAATRQVPLPSTQLGSGVPSAYAPKLMHALETGAMSDGGSAALPAPLPLPARSAPPPAPPVSDPASNPMTQPDAHSAKNPIVLPNPFIRMPLPRQSVPPPG